MGNRYYKRKDPDGQKWCARCNSLKPLAEFTHTRGVPTSYCKPCKCATNMEYRQRVMDRPVEAIADRLWPRVNKDGPGGCHLWTGAIKKQDGYGVLWVGGKLKRVHRIAWELAGRVLPVWPMVLDHACNVRHCLRLEHLQVMSQPDNIRKANARKRAA